MIQKNIYTLYTNMYTVHFQPMARQNFTKRPSSPRCVGNQQLANDFKLQKQKIKETPGLDKVSPIYLKVCDYQL